MPDLYAGADALEDLALEKLKQDLTAKLKAAKKELLETVNANYTQFVHNVSSLSETGEQVDALDEPVSAVKQRVQEAQQQLREMAERLERRLQERARTRERKNFLKRLIDIHETLTKLETLVDPASAPSSAERSAAGERRPGIDRTATTSALIDSDSMVVRDVLVLERIAVEYVHFQYLLTRGEQAPFVEALKWRIERVALVVDRSVKTLLHDAIAAYLQPESQQDLLTQALRICMLLNRMDMAVAVYAEDQLQERIGQLVENSRSVGSSVAQQLQSAYTALLEHYSASLLALLRFVQSNVRSTEYMMFILQTLEVSLDHIADVFPISMFSGAVTAVFFEAFNATTDFFDQFAALLCSDADTGSQLRKSDVYTGYMKRWQVDVYFQIRTRPIVSAFEDLCSTMTSPITPQLLGFDVQSGQLVLPVSQALVSSLQQCWKSDLFLFPLSHRFWKLTLQFVMRYQLWAQCLVDNDEQKPNPTERTLSVPSHRHTPSTGSLSPIDGLPSVLASVAPGSEPEPRILRTFVILQHDLRTVPSALSKVFEEQISTACALDGKRQSDAHASLLQTSARTTDTLAKLSKAIVAILTRRCTEVLKLLRNVTSQYRGTNKPMPTAPSFFVAGILQPAAQFYEEHASLIPREVWLPWMSEIADMVTTRYHGTLETLLADIKKTEESLRRLKRSKGKADNSTEDEDKMRYQLYLDVQQFVADVRTALDGQESAAGGALLALVEDYRAIAIS
ncbi:hypothetical protein RI367_001899 [Sorochytrium milnesiophthora]